MGVTGLWTVVSPTARPTKLETLNRKRLAVDASIWIYQFLKAVRDKEGNALRNSHVVGFFRRICKLLYFGIKPVFVFDGGAPVLKRETIRKRARRREGRRDDAARTAGKLLAVQVARAAEEESRRQREERDKDRYNEEEIPEDQELVYVDELGMDKQQRLAGRGFKKTDQYHLPDLDVSLEQMGAPNDPRVMSQAELEAYAQQFHSGEDINLYDFSKIDFDSPFFLSLPAGDKYNILNAARLRSRLRMGYSKEQLDDMFPDRMAFSRFQIERVKERNELTQRLMHVSGMNEGEWDMGGRIAGERGKEYVLIKHDGVEGGWALGVVSNKKGLKSDDAIDLDGDDDGGSEEPPSEDEEEFEDVAIEGINRLPQSWKRKRHETREVDYDISYEEAAERIAKKRKAVYDSRRKAAELSNKTVQPSQPTPNIRHDESATNSASVKENDMFVERENDGNSDNDEDFEDVNISNPDDDDDDELQRAIAMSLEKPEGEGGFILNENVQRDAQNIQDDDTFDLQAALAESRTSKYQLKTNVRDKPAPLQKKQKFGGPLPFESLNLGQSLLGRKKARKVEEDLSGGFDRDLGGDSSTKKKNALPMPDWFNAAPKTSDMIANIDRRDAARDDDTSIDGVENQYDTPNPKPKSAKVVIDIDAEESISSVPQPVLGLYEGEKDDEMIEYEEVTKTREEVDRKALEVADIAEARRRAEQDEREKRYELARQIAASSEDQNMNQIAEETLAKPPPPSDKPSISPGRNTQAAEMFFSDGSDNIDWSDSDNEMHQKPSSARLPVSGEPVGGRMPDERALNDQSDDDGDLFEDVETHTSPPQPTSRQATPPSLAKGVPEIDQSMFIDDDDDEEGDDGIANTENVPNGQVQPEDFMEDDSDEELMRQLANEAEEHLRFANELNNNRSKSPTQTMRDYEAELKQLRNQQKKDKRDADEVTQTMITECQALLRLFGLPYITAPMEAEAQCAELVHLGLVDGIVTDDSDIFLFGGTRIYKNMFNAAKFVECYLASDLEKEYALDRGKLIRFAHLLGSDYTEGIPGIGPVTALEIISDFADLTEFHDWTKKVQLGSQAPSVMEGLLSTAFRRKFKKTVQKKLFLPPGFPDLRVDQAYLEPEVDSNPEEFQWGVPDLDKLRSFLMATIGWSQERTDEVLVPVIRDMNKRGVEGVQSNITKFFSGSVGLGAGITGRGIGGANGRGPGGSEVVEGTAPRNRTGKESGRMKNAYKRLRGEAERKRKGAFEQDDGMEEASEVVAEPMNGTGYRETNAADDLDEANNQSEENRGSSDDSSHHTARKRKTKGNTKTRVRNTRRSRKAANEG